MSADSEPGHRWRLCPQCGPMVVCGRCGNNCCNGGRGTLPDGAECPACDDAYTVQSRGVPSGLAGKFWLRGEL